MSKKTYTPRGIRLKKKQAQAYSLLTQDKNVFLTGPGGVGKTALLKMFTQAYQEDGLGRKIAVTSTTGTSAILLNGTTLHSFLGIGLGDESVKRMVARINDQRWLRNRWTLLDCLIIDEISMMAPELFDKLERVARIVRGNEEPFGGVQLVLSGDFLQLPCVGTSDFCFQAKSWERCVSHTVNLDEIIRQGDKTFQTCLNEIRLGSLSETTKQILNQRVGAVLDNGYGIKPTKLYSMNVDVDKENDLALDELAETGIPFFRYEMEVVVSNGGIRKKRVLDRFKKCCQAAQELELCVGAQVMLVKNLDVTKGLANGSRAIITGFSKSELPIVQFLNGEERIIGFESWDVEENGRRLFTVYQIPLRVAYAISIHKSQGCSLDYAEIDLSSVFEYGQAYVALSRVKSLTGLSIIAIDYDRIQADPLAVNFYRDLT